MPIQCDFKNQITGEVHIPSTSRKDVTFKEAKSQTLPLTMHDVEMQTITSSLQAVNRIDVQVGHERKPVQATLSGLQYVYAGVNYDEEKLAGFLEREKDDLLAMLQRNMKSSAFDSYEPNWTKKSTDISVVATLSSTYAMEEKMHVLSVCWNSSGTLLAVAYGRLDTAGWCHNAGAVGIWNMSRHDMNVTTPHHFMETDSFVTCIAFHPSQASVLAAGLYSGEVLLYKSVTDDKPTVMSTDGATVTHTEPVTFLQWTENLHEVMDSSRYTLCSAAQDGQILFWTMANKFEQPIAAFTIENKKGSVVGVQSACFSRPGGGGAGVPSSDSVLIIGLENGDVGRARPGVLGAASTRSIDTPMPLDVSWLTAHRGPVQSVDASPYFHNMCLTCSSDGSARLYNVLEAAPLATLEPSAETKHYLYSARFSPFRPSVVALVSRSSFLHIYDLQSSQLKPAVALEAGGDGASLTCVAFNHVSPEWIVTGDTSGFVRVWRLPTSLTQATDAERSAVRVSRGRGTTAPAGDDGLEQNIMVQLFGFSL
ncbi:hypothetical protein ERJ75_001430000 [Trypanosoma vivax]|nr:hypothetical protein ERJ75_001430000 [Trypanosoma vivax]